MPLIKLDEAIGLAVADARRIVASRTTPGGLAIDIGHVVEAFLSGLFVQIVTRLTAGGASYVFKRVSTQQEVDALKMQVIDLLDREELKNPMGRDLSSKLEGEVIALLRERGFSKEVSEEIAASIVVRAQDFVRIVREE